MNETTQPAHQIEADNAVISNIEKKMFQIGPHWPKLAEMAKNCSKSMLYEPYQVAYEMKADDAVNSNIEKNGQNWSQLAKIGQNCQKMVQTQYYMNHIKLHII